MTNDEGNLTSETAGLINIGEENSLTWVYKVNLNLNETKKFNLFEGELVVHKGFNDTKARLNFNRVWKPELPQKSLYYYAFLQKYQNMQRRQAL